MYLDHFGLTRPPFQITPDADFFYPGAERQSILQGLVHSALHNEGIVKVIGEIGSGKSLLCRMLVAELPDNFQVVFLANPNLSANEVVKAILGDLGVSPQPDAFSHPTQLLQTYLLEQSRLGTRVLLLVEEAQAMPVETLEALRLLTNLETAETKLLRMILFGQPELDQTLSEYTLRQFRDRVTQNFYLREMHLEESGEYLHHRLCIAGYQGSPLFHGELLRQLHEFAGGRLRPLNIIADKTLLAAYVNEKLELTEQHLQRALQEIESPHPGDRATDHSSLQNSLASTLAAPNPPPIEMTWRGIGLFICRKISKLARELLIWLQHSAGTGLEILKRSRKHPLAHRLLLNMKRTWNTVSHMVQRK